jgi:uncharacterized protein
MFSSQVQEKLKYYVYLYVDPRTDTIFYIGKGKGNRAFSHLRDRSESEKAKVIDELDKLGREPRIEILKYGLTEMQALLVEGTAIDLLDIKKLTNKVRGHGIRHGTRADVGEICSLLDRREAEIDEPAIVINITRAFRFGMTPHELYDATRVAWVVGNKRLKAKYAISVYRGVVREVYSIAGWVPGGSTMQSDGKPGSGNKISTRWEFVGKVTEDDVRRKYLGKSVPYKKGARNPIMYVNCGHSSEDKEKSV